MVRVVLRCRVSPELEVLVCTWDLHPCAAGGIQLGVQPAVNIDCEPVAPGVVDIGVDADVVRVRDVHLVDSHWKARGRRVGYTEGDDL